MSRPPLRFVVHHHREYGPDHWDLMLEQDEGLATWRLDHSPEKLTAGPISATRIGDHRKVYLTYEGPISGDRGHVRIVDAGSFTILRQETNAMTIAFEGRTLSGLALLRREKQHTNEWALSRIEDRA